MDRLARVRPRVRAREAFSYVALCALAGSLLGRAAPAAAQQAEEGQVVWVWLDPAAIPAAPPAIGPAAMARRAREGIPRFDNDAPIPDALVRTLEQAGLRVRHRSRWLRAVSGVASAGAVERLRALDAVTRITPVGTMSRPRPVETAAAAPAPQAPPPAFYGRSFDQVNQIGVPLAHDLGFTGAGVVVALLDTGFDQEHVALAGLEVIAAYDFIQGDSVVANQAGDPSAQDRHGTQVWSILAGFEPDEFVGPAYGARFLLAKVDHVTDEPRADEDRWVAAIEWADSMGAQVVSSSLGYRCFDDAFCWTDEDLNGDVAPSTIAADEAAARGILVVKSVGNSGRNSLSVPADADSVIAVGAVDAAGRLAAFSSTGPTADGRIKPELVARGVSTWFASASNPTAYGQGNGTSFAAPLVGGGAALFVEAWPDLGAMAARRALLLSGSQQPPSDSMGHGLPDVASAILFPGGIEPIVGPAPGPGDQIASLGPTFTWSVPFLHEAARPVLYRLQIARDSLFNDVVREDSVVDAQLIALQRPLEAAPSLWWRVVAEAAPGVVRTSAGVGPFAMQPWVRLVSMHDAFITDATPTLVWDPLPAPPPVGPLSFDLEIVAAANGDVLQLIQVGSDTSFTVEQALPFNVPILWRVIVHTANGARDTTQSAAPFVVVSSGAPPSTTLYQNFPNPFPRTGTPATTIWFDLERTTRVSLVVYDIRGRQVRRLIPDASEGCSGTRMQLDAGPYGRIADPACVTTQWDGTSDDGRTMPAGVYVIRLVTDEETQTVRTLFRP